MIGSFIHPLSVPLPGQWASEEAVLTGIAMMVSPLSNIHPNSYRRSSPGPCIAHPPRSRGSLTSRKGRKDLHCPLRLAGGVVVDHHVVVCARNIPQAQIASHHHSKVGTEEADVAQEHTGWEPDRAQAHGGPGGSPSSDCRITSSSTAQPWVESEKVIFHRSFMVGLSICCQDTKGWLDLRIKPPLPTIKAVLRAMATPMKFRPTRRRRAAGRRY